MLEQRFVVHLFEGHLHGLLGQVRWLRLRARASLLLSVLGHVVAGHSAWLLVQMLHLGVQLTHGHLLRALVLRLRLVLLRLLDLALLPILLWHRLLHLLHGSRLLRLLRLGLRLLLDNLL